MATRPVFRSTSTTSIPFSETVEVDFEFFSGFSLAQKQRSIASLHAAYALDFPGDRVLEVSSRSTEPLGVAMSAFNLMIETSKRAFSVECAFQGSKVFELGGPYSDLLDSDSHAAKKDERLRTSGRVVGFRFHGVDYPTEPKDLFYNWIYANALVRQGNLLAQACAYDAFTDIEFNPAKSINCQARAAAIAVGLSRAGKLEEALASVSAFEGLVYGSAGEAPSESQPALF